MSSFPDLSTAAVTTKTRRWHLSKWIINWNGTY